MAWKSGWMLELSSLVLFISALFSALLLTLSHRRNNRGPPGPPALPFIGHLHLLAGAPNPGAVLAKLSRRYGPLISIKLGAIPAVVASTPDAARQVLQTHDRALAYRPRLAVAMAVFGNSPGIGFEDPGPNLKFIRQLCATHLFSPLQLQRFQPLMDEEVKNLLQAIYLESVGGGPESQCCAVHLHSHLLAAANNIISRMVVRDKMELLRPVMVEVADALSALDLGEYIPCIRWADLQGCRKRSERVGLKVHALLKDLMDSRRALRDGVYDPPADILDMLLAASSASPPNVDLADARIRAMLSDILAGGSGTTATLLEWAMAELLANPSKMKAAEDEIHSVLSSKKKGLVEESDIQSMPYLRAVMKETMRLYPLAPLLLPREARKACSIYGYDIPAKTLAFVNVWAIGRDGRVWDNPEDFVPERFVESDKDIDIRGQHFELLPFGSGRRSCPGQNLGMRTFQQVLCNLLHAFSWSPCEPDHDMLGKGGFGLKKAKPLLAFATAKLPKDFYVG